MRKALRIVSIVLLAATVYFKFRELQETFKEKSQEKKTVLADILGAVLFELYGPAIQPIVRSANEVKVNPYVLSEERFTNDVARIATRFWKKTGSCAFGLVYSDDSTIRIVNVPIT